ncbi:antibiotic biosynthesis monooxygenase [Psychroserpens sp. SPM9]|uniref:antibiotic biosynthesis monooxygenase family protein n=1 Tax=Psychroserpens sp. SPM9 TaxID=2975598 RepID=UPI0021A74178|nr:antibiotic biosynthesis monooxygenase family protein [Psychroserpens sp. SPM9]MDG5492902.1 antibiotic biosynthesis monooxygenase [Psychroserpens sp. SPM9]
MVVVLFEVKLHSNAKSKYLEIAKSLNTELNKQKGFISLERFESIEEESKLLSLQIWKNEEAIIKWKNNKKHQSVMPLGYNELFKDYSIKILAPIRSYTKYSSQ